MQAGGAVQGPAVPGLPWQLTGAREGVDQGVLRVPSKGYLGELAAANAGIVWGFLGAPGWACPWSWNGMGVRERIWGTIYCNHLGGTTGACVGFGLCYPETALAGWLDLLDHTPTCNDGSMERECNT